jgi:hypothetical protein
MKQTEHDRTPRPAARKPYATPRLVAYGHVRDIVQGGGTKVNDPGTGNATKPQCWVAQALYGADSARTMLVRSWLTDLFTRKRRGWRLVSLYIAWGPTVAEMIRRGRLPRQPFLRLFDALTRRAFAESAETLRTRRALARQSAAGAAAADAA